MHFWGGGERGTRKLNSALAILEEAEVEDAPYLYSQCVTRLGGAGGYSGMDLILISFIRFWLEKKYLESAS